MNFEEACNKHSFLLHEFGKLLEFREDSKELVHINKFKEWGEFWNDFNDRTGCCLKTITYLNDQIEFRGITIWVNDRCNTYD